ncbi:hypothetical protein EYR26_16455 [Xanthomonas oryzae]|nr:hypothetical protein EYR26_16455 [Xanthomonas oryzae]
MNLETALASIFGCTAMIFFIGIRLGRRFVPFIDMAEPIFTLLGWNDVKNVDLRKNLFTIFFKPCKLHECARRTIQVT